MIMRTEAKESERLRVEQSEDLLSEQITLPPVPCIMTRMVLKLRRFILFFVRMTRRILRA